MSHRVSMDHRIWSILHRRAINVFNHFNVGVNIRGRTIDSFIWAIDASRQPQCSTYSH